MNALASWKTTFLGIAGLVAVAAKFVKTGVIDATDWASITGSIGLIFAKDNNVTGAK